MLVEKLKVLLASLISLSIKTQQFHWCVEGPDFPQYHAFFGTLYQDLTDNAIDQTAEYIRILGQYTPGSLTRVQELSIIDDQLKIPRAQLMVAELHSDNVKISELINECISLATAENKQGILDYLAGRLDVHEKWVWQLTSTLKVDRA